MNYEKLKNLTTNVDIPLSGMNEDGENIIITIGYDEDAQMEFYDVHTYQHNGWIRSNIYWEDGTIEELFDEC